MVYRIHILGAAGTGCTSLGKVLAEHLNIACFDSDFYYWQQTLEPFSIARPRDERLRLLQEHIAGHQGWVLSDSLCGWGDAMIPLFTHVVFLRVEPQVRLQRLRLREAQRYGEQILEGGSRHQNSVAFLTWVARYDTGNHSLRSLRRHETWLKPLNCPVIRLDATHHSVEELANQLMPLLNPSTEK